MIWRYFKTKNKYECELKRLKYENQRLQKENGDLKREYNILRDSIKELWECSNGDYR